MQAENGQTRERDLILKSSQVLLVFISQENSTLLTVIFLKKIYRNNVYLNDRCFCSWLYCNCTGTPDKD